jgi:hypothetical protein
MALARVARDGWAAGGSWYDRLELDVSAVGDISNRSRRDTPSSGRAEGCSPGRAERGWQEGRMRRRGRESAREGAVMRSAAEAREVA